MEIATLTVLLLTMVISFLRLVISIDEHYQKRHTESEIAWLEGR